MFKFIVDTQLPPLIAEFLKYKGFDAVHTSNYPDGVFMSDKEISKIAALENRIIITKDTDFLDIFILNKIQLKIILVETGNLINKELLKILSDNLAKIIDLLNNNDRLIILQRNNIISY